MRSCWRSKVALTPIGTFRGAEAGTRAGGGFASGVVGQSLGRGYGSCRTLVRSSRERAAERRELFQRKVVRYPKTHTRPPNFRRSPGLTKGKTKYDDKLKITARTLILYFHFDVIAFDHNFVTWNAFLRWRPQNSAGLQVEIRTVPRTGDPGALKRRLPTAVSHGAFRCRRWHSKFSRH